jgi:cysteine desulfurase/selenocysteine lyase
MDAVQEHERELIRHAVQSVAALDGVRIYGTAERKCGVLSFNLDGIDPFDLALVLDGQGIAVRSGTHCAEPVMRHYGVRRSVRASLALYNTVEEIDALVDGVQKARRMLL